MDEIERVHEVLEYKEKIVVAQIAPALRVSIGEEFGFPVGKILTKKFVGALKQAGFQKVFDTSVAADVVTVEEGIEFISRLEKKENLPLFTSCCPGSMAFIENKHSELVYHFCTVKSPQQTMGALIKTYYAEKMNIPQEKIFVVSIMPCAVKKFESRRPEMDFNGIHHVDAVLTTKDIAVLLKNLKIDLNNVKENDFDSLLENASGAGQIFGVTGGVSESLLRFVSHKLEPEKKKIEFKKLRGKEGRREIELSIAGKKLKIAIVHGLQNLNNLILDKNEFDSFQVIEMMACPGGCIGGGGQPVSTPEIREKRIQALRKIDSKEKVRVSSDNPEVKELYKSFLKNPGSETAKELLHTRRICFKCD